ncbi:TIGR03943 family protein [Pseudonocardia sp. KRD291]|uniref:TIGR03943 family putative permease subunit n=1 Tax=Pseudonocardia sp. KRD291 TaxID=2792007 RepID=UPI001C4A577A|nr:TIGR03943 family protein [Pseudonocardia sp. KRD291]MBW0102216.1 TIGR03943 family protein [Pseudonocardia sp. KRD291]
MRRDTQHALLLVLGGVMLRVCVDDSVLRYVRPGHRWLLVAAGTAAVGLAVVGAVRDLRGRTHAADDDHAHDRSHAPWLLLLPVLVIALVAPPALGADAVNRTSGGTVRSGDLYPPLPGGTLALGLGDVVDRAVWDDSRSVAGREVVVTGFLARHRGDVVLARMRISCCAADARPSMLRLRGTAPEGPLPDGPLPDGGERWLQVRGTVVPGTGNVADRYVPDLTISALTPVPAPSDPYES